MIKVRNQFYPLSLYEMARVMFFPLPLGESGRRRRSS